MTSNERATWIKRIASLLNHANHPNANAEEAASAAAKAAALMLKFQIEDAELVREGKRQRSNYTGRRVRHGRSTFEQRLMYAIAQANFCGVVTLRMRSGAMVDEIIGSEDAAEIVEYLYVWFRREVDRLARAEYRDSHSRTTWTAFHTSFRMGALKSIREKLEEQRKQAEGGDQADAVQALIVVRDADLNAAIADMFPGLKSTKFRTVTVDTDAYNAGIEAGSTLAAPRALNSGDK